LITADFGVFEDCVVFLLLKTASSSPRLSSLKTTCRRRDVARIEPIKHDKNKSYEAYLETHLPIARDRACVLRSFFLL
jgi:hypothetical protein